MAKKEILPAVNRYIIQLLESAERKQRISQGGFISGVSCDMESDLIVLLSELEDKAYEDKLVTALFCKDKIIPAMNELRTYVDKMESNTAKDLWPLPSYGDMLFSV